ncbi:hypothetical protein [uncultured Bacteroides sp.]|uniref:hypothetical protein n=1 Tax=uncultured Bacteroides sp. TaxID=162156 RepID=UPI0025D34966|nr:hypothetical protein [uncultured Bacteroides sp.]
MKVEHLTFKGSSLVRDTNIIEPRTVEFFKNIQAGAGEYKIDNTPYTCKVSSNDKIAVFDLWVYGKPCFVNYCCFSKDGRDEVMGYINDIAKEIDPHYAIAQPKEEYFIYSFVFLPDNLSSLLGQENVSIAGEIELYIYDAIYRGLNKKESPVSDKDNKESTFVRYEVGKTFPLKKYLNLGELTVAVFTSSSFDILVSFGNVTKAEVNVFQKSEFEIGLYSENNVPYIYVNFTDKDNPLSFDVSMNIKKLTKEQEDEWLDYESNVVNLYLVDSNTGVLKAMRTISIDFMNDIKDILEGQVNMTMDEVNSSIDLVTSFHDTEYLIKNAIKRMKFKRR